MRLQALWSLLRVLLVFEPFRCLAWSNGGHMVVAAEAYRQLSPAEQAKVAEVLKAHPEYDRWSDLFRNEAPGADFGMFVFMKASIWPDEIRRHHSQYEHLHWHYIDYPLRPTAFPIEPGPAPADDALYGIQKCEEALGNASMSPELRAVYLSYLIHLIGDLHQPLHCGSLFNDQFPMGDKGGNDFYIKPGSKGIKLHLFWDELLGTSVKPHPHLNYAVEIQSRFPRTSLKELKRASTPKEWSLESRALAIDKVYSRGQLKGSTRADLAPNLPAGYTKMAKAVAERQAALAGYRLADEVTKYLR